MAVDRVPGQLEPRQGGAQRIEHQLEHLGAVLGRIVLRPPEGLDVEFERPGALAQIRKVPVRQLRIQRQQLLAGERDEVAADPIPNPARARVEHHPHAVALVETELDEVIAATEGADLALPRIRVLRHPSQGRHLVDKGVVALVQARDAVLAHAALVMHVEADRHPRLDLRSHPAERVRQRVRIEREPGRDHPAADVHPHRGRNDRGSE